MRLALFAAIAALAACSPQPSAEATPAATAAAVHPVSGLKIIPVTVATSRGKHTFRAEVAASAAEQQRGLMFRTSMGPDEAMIFPRNPPGPASFWMSNTPLPLDIIYIGPDRKVINIANGEPYSLESLPAAGPTAAVLELNAGRAAELGIVPGTRIDW